MIVIFSKYYYYIYNIVIYIQNYLKIGKLLKKSEVKSKKKKKNDKNFKWKSNQFWSKIILPNNFFTSIKMMFQLFG